MFRMKDIYTLDMEWDGTEAWFICAYTNILFKINSENQVYTFVALLPQNGSDNYDFHSQCVKYGEVIYCLPNRGQDIYIYDISKTSFRKIDLKSTNGERINLDKLCVVGDILYTISYGMGEVIEINLKDEKIVNRYPITEDNMSIYKAIMYKNNIYAVSMEKACLIRYDLDKRKSQCISIIDNMENKHGFSSLGHMKNQIWMCGYDNHLYSYDLCENKSKDYFLLPDNIKFYDFDNNNLYREKRDDDFYFQECVCFDDSVWFIPYQTNKILYIKAHENIIKEMVIEDEEETVKNMNRIVKRKYFVVKIESEKNFIIKSFKNECLYRINICDETVEKISTKKYEYGNLEELMMQYGKNNKVISEISAVDRNLYIYKIFFSTNNNFENEDNLMIGKSIYNKLIE